MDIQHMKHEPLPISNLSEYQVLFNLTPEDLGKKIIDFPAGLNSFSAEMFQQNHHVVACDESYVNTSTLKQLAEKIIEENQQDAHKTATIKHFEKDFPQGLKENRYVAGKLPKLPFSNHQFDLLLCSFFFFFNGDSIENGWNNLMEMLRIATEVRISPLLADQNPETLLGPLMLKLQTYSFGIEIRSISFPKLPASAMLRVWSQHCPIT